MDLEKRTSDSGAASSQHLPRHQETIGSDPGSDMTSQSKNIREDAGAVAAEDGSRSGGCESDAVAPPDHEEDDRQALGDDDGVSDLSKSDLSSPPEACVPADSKSLEEEMNYEVQQAYRIFSSFLVDKYKSVTGLFLRPVGHQVGRRGVGGALGRGQAQLKQSMCLQRMEEKFVRQEYESITEFVADFRLMLENCYRYHGVDHWISKQAQKLEILLEQKLTLLSR